MIYWLIAPLVVLLLYGLESALYRLLEDTAPLLVILLAGFWVAGNIFAGLRFQKAEGWLGRFARAWGQVFMFTALYQGVVLTVLFAWAFLYSLGAADIPDDPLVFAWDMVMALSWFGALIYGATGGLALMAGDVGRLGQLAALAMLLMSAALAIVPIGWEAEVRQWMAADGGRRLLLAVNALLLAMSPLGMWLVVFAGMPPSKKYAG
jgi:hypothetical protein